MDDNTTVLAHLLYLDLDHTKSEHRQPDMVEIAYSSYSSQ